jgi:predicted phosphodiesterase
MRTLIFSDTHLGKKFSKRECNYLIDLFSKFDQIIINGDFWDEKKISFDAFMTSPWARLFPTLKAKKAIYIHGNHDPADKTDERVREFCDISCHYYNLRLPDGTMLHIEHGQNMSLLSVLSYKLFRKSPKFLKYITVLVNFPLKYLQLALMYSGKKGIRLTNKAMNYGYIKKNKKKNCILVMGHTHAIYFDIESLYINTGFIDKNFASYLAIHDKDMSLIRNYY